MRTTIFVALLGFCLPIHIGSCSETEPGLYGRVIKKTNDKPLSEATVRAVDGDETIGTTETNDDGYFKFVSIDPSGEAIDITVEKEGWLEKTQTFESVDVSRPTRLPTFEIKPLATVTGKLVNPYRDKSPTDCRVRIGDAQTRPSEDGTFELDPVPPGDRTIEVSCGEDSVTLHYDESVNTLNSKSHDIDRPLKFFELPETDAEPAIWAANPGQPFRPLTTTVEPASADAFDTEYPSGYEDLPEAKADSWYRPYRIDPQTMDNRSESAQKHLDLSKPVEIASTVELSLQRIYSDEDIQQVLADDEHSEACSRYTNMPDGHYFRAHLTAVHYHEEPECGFSGNDSLADWGDTLFDKVSDDTDLSAESEKGRIYFIRRSVYEPDKHHCLGPQKTDEENWKHCRLLPGETSP